MSAEVWERLRQTILNDPAQQADLWKTTDPVTFRARLTELGAPAEGPWPWASGPLRVPGFGAPPSPRRPAGPGWLPAQVEAPMGALVVEWVYSGEEPLTQPFYGQDIQRWGRHPLNQFLAARTGLEVLIPADDEGQTPAGLIFHMSRCGSTLVSNMLGALPEVLAAAEPQPIGMISRLSGDADLRARILRGTVAAIAEGSGFAGRPVVLKLEARAILELEVFRQAFPQAPWVFVHRDPLEVLTSQSREPGTEMIPGMAGWELQGLTPQDAAALAQDEYSARILGLICSAAAEGLASQRGLAIAHRDLPRAVWTIAGHFGLRTSAADRAKVEGLAHLDAKRPGKTFDKAGATGDPALRGLADRWIRAAYEQMVDTGRLARQAAPSRAIASVLKLPMTFDADRLKRELALVEPDEWVSHYNRGYYEGDWSALPLRSSGGGPRQINPSATDPEAFADTAHMDRFPYVREILAAFEMSLRSVRFLKLAAGSAILEHTDEFLGYGDGQVRFHIPIQTNPRVEFMLGGERRDMAPGEVWYLDFNLPHSVANRGDTDRIHLVIDGLVNPWIVDLFAAADA